MADTVRTGLVGAGPWATVMHAPLLAGGPGTSLEAVWARREDAATELARQYGASVAGSFDELLERCDAIAFAESLGLAPVFETARMYTGSIPPLRIDRVFGVTTFELG